MFLKKHISFLIFLLIFSISLAGCKNRNDNSSSHTVPGGEDLTHSDVSSEDTVSSDVSSTESAQSSQTSSVTSSNPNKPPVSSTASHLHSFKVERIAPTCTEDGYTLYRCVECGETKIDSYVSKKGHSWSEWITVTEPTTTSEGVRERTCTDCDEKETEGIAMLAPDYDALQKEVFELVNQERANVGLQALTYRENAQICADIRAEEITVKFEHTRPDGNLCFTVLSDNGITYNTVGENIASGQSTAQAVMDSWMNSTEGHKEAILSDEYKEIVIGVTVKDGFYYWVQIFIG